MQPQLTHTIHIPVMEKAERLTGRTIQAVIGLVRSCPCPKHGATRGLQTGDRRQWDGETGWGVGVTNTKGNTLGWT